MLKSAGFDTGSSNFENDTIIQICGNGKFEYEKFTEWFSSTPLYTTFRVNRFRANIDHVIGLITDQLRKQKCQQNYSGIPKVSQDGILKDCIVIGNWLTLDRVHPTDDEVIVDVPCGISVLRGAHVFAPGVMAMSPGVKESHSVSVYADVSKKCLKGYTKKYDDSFRKFIGNGVVRLDRKSLFEATNQQKSGIAVEMIQTVSGVPAVVFPEDVGLLQNYPSILCSHVLGPTESDIVLDMCASPGNKTTHIASLMNGKGHVIAIDKTENKVRRINENCARQKLDNVKTYVYDSTKAATATESDFLSGPPFHENTFDRILLDAPCSALGQRPQLETSFSNKHLKSYPIIQRKLISVAVQLLKLGGVLVYSTCTLSVEENEKMIAWALKQFPQIRLMPAQPFVGSSGVLNCGLSEEQCRMVQKFGPTDFNSSLRSHHNDTVGFFIAKLKKENT